VEDSVSIRDFLIAISRLPEDRPVHNPKKWYLTQKEHWIGWLFEYNGAGAYGRKTTDGRDAKFVYNHVVQPEMLVYLAQASGVARAKVTAARKVLGTGQSLMRQSAAIRMILPWGLVASALWPNNSFKPKPLRGSA
jgi:hypothetical protein